ncbi:hypothetical protein MN116_002648 [Schistosoma mekongi]|uniref:Tetraspanin n=1 Tax=Schistosoma mekongi TaxID=38744 RepID=A0AAE1ZI47_SCHME|nr:hypothetical protein MN116_002648 [Schistosoma mekongi]
MAQGCLLFTTGNIGIVSVLAERRIINTMMIIMFRNIMNDAIDQYMSKSSGYATFVDTIQLRYNCCGADSYTDYTVSNLSIPISCFTNGSISLYNKGCAKQLDTIVSDYLIYIIISLIASIPIEIVSMICSMRILDDLENISWRTRFVYC